MFLFALTNPGSEKALKLEVAMGASAWRPSYQRRGFVSFKSEQDVSVDSLDVEIACARRLCLSLGKYPAREEATAAIRAHPLAHPATRIQHAKYFERKMQGVPEATSPCPVEGEVIGTVVELGPQEFWSGLHRHGRFSSPDPAGDGGLIMPSRSPSRAWLKLEEAVRFFGLIFTREDVVVELGCAPGGVILALLDRGVAAIGVDPAKMADVVLESAVSQRDNPPQDRPWFYHVRKPAALVAKRDLGNGVTWFMSDMNQMPAVVLKECERFCKMAPAIRNVLLTLKLTDLTEVAEKAAWFATLRTMGFKTIRLQQLAVHHRELALLAMK